MGASICLLKSLILVNLFIYSIVVKIPGRKSRAGGRKPAAAVSPPSNPVPPKISKGKQKASVSAALSDFDASASERR